MEVFEVELKPDDILTLAIACSVAAKYSTSETADKFLEMRQMLIHALALISSGGYVAFKDGKE